MRSQLEEAEVISRVVDIDIEANLLSVKSFARSRSETGIVTTSSFHSMMATPSLSGVQLINVTAELVDNVAYISPGPANGWAISREALVRSRYGSRGGRSRVDGRRIPCPPAGISGGRVPGGS